MSHEDTPGLAHVTHVFGRALSRRSLLRGTAAALGTGAVASLIAACGGSTAGSPTSTTASSGGTTGGGATPTAGTGGGTTASPAASGTQPATTGSGSTPRKGGNLIVAFNADPTTFDPHVTTALLAAQVIALTNDNLIDRDYDGSFKPAMAEKWDVSADGKTYTFTLKKGITFHSGKAFTSADVKYTFTRWASADLKSPTAYTIQPLDTMDTPDDQTITFKLKDVYNIFLDQLAGSYAVVLNQAAVDKAGKDYGVNTVDGTGPYKFVSWTRNQSIKFSRFDAFNWNSPVFQNPGPAYVDTLEIQIVPEDNTRVAQFQSGNIQVLHDVPAAQVQPLSSTPGVKIIKYDQLQTTYLGMNTTKPPVDDVNVRMAINYALNRDEIVTGANFGLGISANTMLAPATPYYWQGSQQIAPTFDLNKAKQILDQAGWKAGSDGMRSKNGTALTLPLWIINDSTTTLQAQIIQQQLAKAGINVQTKQYEQTAWFAAASKGDQVGYIIGVFYDNADVLYFYFYSKQQPAPNRFLYSNADVDKWLLDTRANPDKTAVTQDYQNIQKQLIQDAPAAPFIHSGGTLGVTNTVNGVKVHPSRWLYRMTDLWLSQ